MKRKYLKLMTLALVTFLLVGCTTSTTENTPDSLANIATTKSDMSEYQLAEADHIFYDLSFEEFESLLDYHKDGIIYIGSPGCPFCLEAAPLLNQLCKDYGTFAYSLSFETDEQLNKFQEEIFVDFLSEDERINGLQIPHVFIVKDGKIIADHLGTVSTHDAHERVMNESEVEELSSIYSKMIEKLN